MTSRGDEKHRAAWGRFFKLTNKIQQANNPDSFIRSTAQSLLDYVPYGATTEGYGGTYATQENFRIMRAALDEAGEEMGRYIRLVNYASGLCMPEIAALGALESAGRSLPRPWVGERKVRTPTGGMLANGEAR